ncbi:MAG: RIP metalloprotease RseP [Acidobacteriota bacterium]|nr:RIP metalloprotease RseP [Acidobacteriota bacterium]
MLISILAFVFVIGVLITIHEFGHFAVARLLGAPVEVFSIGFGKRIWGFERGGTDYRLSLVPLGGYVRIIGLGPDETDVVSGDAQEVELLPRWRRALILLAGPVTNILAAVVFVTLALTMGVETPLYLEQPPVVGWVGPGSPAEAANIQPGDTVQAVSGEPMEMWRDLEVALLTSGKGPVELTVERNGRVRMITVTLDSESLYGFGVSGIEPRLEAVVQPAPGVSPAAQAGIESGDLIVAVNGETVDQYYDLPRLIVPLPATEITLDVLRGGQPMQFTLVTRDEGGQGKIGVGPVLPTVVQKLALLPALGTAAQECERMTYQTFRVIGRLFTGKESLRQVSGPVGIAQISGQAARSGIQSLIMLLGIISLQLGIFNLLPIPILDGGHLVIIAFESITRRDLPMKLKERVLEVGFYLLILLMVVVLFNDIVRLLPEGVRQFFYRG